LYGLLTSRPEFMRHDVERTGYLSGTFEGGTGRDIDELRETFKGNTSPLLVEM
jgi:hypothetical protein